MSIEMMYKELILDHYKHPQNFGKLENADVTHREANVLCGDVIEIQLKFNGEKKISDAKFTGSGCAISQASTDILTGSVKGKRIDDIKNMDSGYVLKLLGIEISPMRLKCALLPLAALKSAVKK